MTERDPNKLKIASFRTKEGVWAEFCTKAESANLTATDVLRMAMADFVSGTYAPSLKQERSSIETILERLDRLERELNRISTTLNV